MRASSNAVTEITPPGGGAALQFREIAQYRELFFFLVWREVKLRYKQAALGAAWVILQPLLTMLVFSLFFGKLAKMPSDGIPYPVFALCGLVPWMFFANAVSQSSASLISSGNLVRKVYFPRWMVPLSTVASGLIDLSLSLAVLGIVMLFYGAGFSGRAIGAVPFLTLAVVAAVGVSLWLSALAVKYRDVRYVVPFLTQFWMFATPVAYPTSLLAGRWRPLYGLNPLVGAIEGLRATLLRSSLPPASLILASGAVAAILLISGAMYFRRVEGAIADVL